MCLCVKPCVFQKLQRWTKESKKSETQAEHTDLTLKLLGILEHCASSIPNTRYISDLLFSFLSDLIIDAVVPGKMTGFTVGPR